MFFMKKFNLLVLSVAVLTSGFFSSCKKEADPNGPQISFSNSLTETTLAKGVTQWEVNATITSVAGLDQVKVFQVSTAGEDQLGTAITSFTDKNTYNLKLTVTGIKELTTIKVSATDKNNITNSQNFVIKITAADPIPATDKVLFWTGTVAAQLGAQSSIAGSSFASSTGNVYTQSLAKTNQTLVDMIYYYNTGADAASIYSPLAASNGSLFSSTWTTKNDTKFIKVTTLTPTEFDAIPKTDDAQIVAKATGFTDVNKLFTLSVGNIFAFKTAANKLGLAKVTALTGTTAGTITIEVKVQK